MNKIIFSAFFALYCFCLQAQQISVEFSIEWKKDLDFQITGGTFTFQFDDTKSLDYVEIEPVREERNVNATVQYSTQKLPEKVGIYELFKGDFLTNKATVQFPGIKTKK